LKTPVYACVHAPEFPAQAALRLRHAFRAHPVAVLEGHPPLERVCSANALARREGVSDSMTRVEAESFARLVLIRRSLREEAEARSALLACAAKYTPAIEDASTANAATCVLDLTGTEKLFGSPPTLAERLKRELSGFGIHASLALSANFHAAIASARAVPGISQIAPGEEQHALAPLLVSVLPLMPEQGETLALWGIRTLGCLAALPERELVARMGQSGKHLRALARGEHPHLFQPITPEFELRESYEFDAPVAILDSLLFVLAPMLDQLLLRARERALALAAVTARLRLEGGGEHVRVIRPALPTSDRKLLLKLLHLDLTAHPPGAAVLWLEVTADQGEASKVQLGLFSPQLPESSRLDVTLARLRALVGDAQVGSPQLKDTHAPDSFLIRKLAISPARSTLGPTSESMPALRRVRPAAPLTVRVADAVPRNFWYGSQPYQVIEAHGPWRESGNWWSAAAVWSREQWDVIAESAAVPAPYGQSSTARLCCRLAHDLLRKQWALEAIYD
jgi:protein ImuB